MTDHADVIRKSIGCDSRGHHEYHDQRFCNCAAHDALALGADAEQWDLIGRAAVERYQVAEEALRRIRENALAFHKGNDGKACALAVIADWAWVASSGSEGDAP